MQLKDIIVPTEQREGNEASVHRWLKSPGDAVKKDEPIVEINTDKVTLEVAAPETGILKEILKNPKEKCDLSEVLGRIEIAALAGGTKEIAKTNKSLATESSKTVANGARFSPAVRSLSAEKGIDPQALSGSGAGGRVTARDVEKSSDKPTKKPTVAVGGSSFIPHSPMRKAIAEHMQHSVSTAPHVTSVFEADLSAMIEHRKRLAPELAKSGTKLTFTSYFLRAIAIAIGTTPEVNARWHDDKLEIFSDINIGIATAVANAQGGGAGLIVPVLRNVQKLSLKDVAAELGVLTEKARRGALSSADQQGGTFTISNHGVSGSLFASPIIINQPQVAILGIGKLEKRIVVQEREGRDSIEIVPSAYVTLTIDHRALDGFIANSFLTSFVSALQRPDEL